MQIKDIQDREDIELTFSVLKQIYLDLNESSYIEDVLNMMQRGYKMAAVFEDKKVENGRCIGVIGIRIIRKLNYGKSLEIEDFMIDRQKRGIGVGKMLMRWAEWQAAVFGCKYLIGNLGTKREESQRIYAREGFEIEGISFKKLS